MEKKLYIITNGLPIMSTDGKAVRTGTLRTFYYTKTGDLMGIASTDLFCDDEHEDLQNRLVYVHKETDVKGQGTAMAFNFDECIGFVVKRTKQYCLLRIRDEMRKQSRFEAGFWKQPNDELYQLLS